MRRRRPLSDNPTAIGAMTVLIAVVVVFMAYNANSGLPFVGSYRVAAHVPDAAALVAGNEVRLGGVRVGLVESIEPVAGEDGEVSARLGLKLDQAAAPIPADTTVLVRSLSALGLKYVELSPGRAGASLAEGSSLPLSAARPRPVELDQVLNVFDERTRRAQSESLAGLGGGLAGRGVALNSALGTLPVTLRLLAPVARNLASAPTRLRRLIRAAAATAGEAAPVGERQARLFVAAARTFEAIAAADEGLGRTIETAPGALRQARISLPNVAGLVSDTADLAAELRPSARRLTGLAPRLDRSFAIAAPAFELAPRLNDELAPTTAALRRFGEDAGAQRGLRALRELGDQLSPTVRFVAPAQTVCNYPALLLRNLASVFSLGDGVGTRQRFIAFQPPLGRGGEGAPAAGPADGPGKANHLHYNPYPNAAAPGQDRECEAGNESYEVGKTVIGNVAGNQGTETEPSR